MIGQPLPAAGAGVGTAQLSSLYTVWTRTLARGAVGYTYGVSGRLARRLVSAPRLAAPGVCRAARRGPVALETLRRRRYAPPRRRKLSTPRVRSQAAPTPYSLPISYPRVSTMRSGSADDPPSEK